MFLRFSAISLLAVAIVTSARMERHSHMRRNSTSPNSDCSTGDIRCCNSIANATNLASLLDMLSLSYDPADSIGIDCTPLNLYGLGDGGSCLQQPVCCSNNTFSGFINIGCSPLDLI